MVTVKLDKQGRQGRVAFDERTPKQENQQQTMTDAK
jgi:hypothetical protein